MIFSKVNWVNYLTATLTAANGDDDDDDDGGGGAAARGAALAALLALFCEVNVAAPAAVSSAVRLAILGDGPSAGAIDVQLRQLHEDVWRLVDGRALADACDGSALLAPLRRGAVTDDPSRALVENVALVYAAAARSGDARALAAAREARAVLRFSSATPAATCTGTCRLRRTRRCCRASRPRCAALARTEPLRTTSSIARSSPPPTPPPARRSFSTAASHFHRRTRRRTNCLTTPRCCSGMAAAAAAGCPRRRWPRARASRAGLAAAVAWRSSRRTRRRRRRRATLPARR